MIRSVLPVGAALLGCASTVLAADQPTCSLTQKCPESAPCCSQYGQCGVGAYCLGGCDPRMSHTLDSCVPAPVCQSKKYPMTSLDGIVDVSKYLGDPKTADWVAQGEPLLFDGSVLLTMPAKSVGTVLASSTYMWYGSVKAKLKTSRDAGVVTAFILLSDVKDEIDYEFVGTELDIAQTNYYYQGIPSYVNSGNITGLSNTYDNFHEYEIQWTPDQITWLVDGKVGRTKKKSETFNATTNQYDYPQTPARVQLSIWPGGADTNAKGTVDWAGGKIDWNSAEIKNYGYYFATFGEIEVKCFDAKSPPGTNTGTSYTYNSAKGTNDTVIDGDKPTILKSFQGTGVDMDKGGNKASGTSSGSASDATPNTVPGGTSTGPGTNGPAAGNDNGSGSGGSSGGGGGGGSGTDSGPKCESTGFSQSCGGNGNSNGNSGKSDGQKLGGERILGASGLAAVVALAGMLLL
ncbi:uncharacterized protein E0L32_011702 [Thyridium curvatum]|uniref:GH16 domain-containing protein n=1 Tax=Thyridium curvatum TaxID=1093900 RepID=A0A507BGB2_9PEZI|nr:uncharacterized protein E0L32_011683 [Thyridium curvatum]XP_031000126.1 uncharacterized protein E0L32_011702 [Thyridium curvatum]TPX18396.1 hypothetical protein E0L32_011683 [Thyridium curvatum]TPX18415.1 hypothetical protein E0L32_011702 [Thyridium curvatum]